MKNTKRFIPVLALATVLVACGGGKGESDVTKTYTYNTFTTVSPSNWNELTYQDANDTQIMSYISGSFFTYDFSFDAQGKIEDGKFKTCFDGATAIEDVTEDYAGNKNYGVPEDADKGFAYKITLRDDLKWDDGTEIHAKDFVYSMKQQLDPLFQNYRADSYYVGSTVIHNASNYVYQGQSGWFASKTCYGGVYDEKLDENLIFVDNIYNYDTSDEKAVVNSYFIDWFQSNYSKYFGYLKTYGVCWVLENLFEMSGVTAAMGPALQGHTLAEIKADATLSGYWNAIIGGWQTEPGEELDFFVTNYTFPAVDFGAVGIFAGEGEKSNELYLVLDKALVLLDDEGGLTYKCAYNFSSLPLVKESLYEKCKHEPATGSTLWTTDYNSSVETSASWGPYKLTYFQAKKQYVLERNPYWYGYNMPEYKGQYQTDKIVCDTIEKAETAWLSFQAGDLASIGISQAIGNTDCKNSSRAYFTADDYIGSMQLQSNAAALKGRETEGYDKEMLTYVDFRKALSVGFNRAEYLQETSVASKAGFGIFNSMHYYDVANGGVYRNEIVAMKVILDVYGVEYASDASDETIKELYSTVTGYDIELARQLVDKAYDDAIEAGTLKATDTVKLTVGTSVDNESTRLSFNAMKKQFDNIMKGTKLENKFELEFNASFGDKWATDFRDGAYDICTGGWSGAAWDPGYFLLAYLDPAYMYSQAWDTAKAMLTYDPDGEGTDYEALTMSLLDWYDCLNGDTEAAYNWAEGMVENEFRLGIIAALEKEILSVYYTVPLYNYFSASLLSYKYEYATRNYNTFLGYGGIRYMTYNYSDQDWEAVKGTFDYKK